jgi:hypothetical protein
MTTTTALVIAHSDHALTVNYWENALANWKRTRGVWETALLNDVLSDSATRQAWIDQDIQGLETCDEWIRICQMNIKHYTWRALRGLA